MKAILKLGAKIASVEKTPFNRGGFSTHPLEDLRSYQMDSTAIHNMDEKELTTYLEECYKELFNLRFTYAVARSLQNPSRIRQLKRTIARILTIQREKGFAIGISTDLNVVKKAKKKWSRR